MPADYLSDYETRVRYLNERYASLTPEEFANRDVLWVVAKTLGGLPNTHDEHLVNYLDQLWVDDREVKLKRFRKALAALATPAERGRDVSDIHSDFEKYRKSKAPAVAPAAKADDLGAFMPLPQGVPMAAPGNLMETGRLSEYEKKALRKLNWKDGDPVPADLAKMIAAAAEESKFRLPVAPDTPPLVVPDSTPIDQLSPEKRAEISGAIAAAAAYGKVVASARSSEIPGADPSINRAITMAEIAERQQQQASVRVTEEPAPEGSLPLRKSDLMSHAKAKIDHDKARIAELEAEVATLKADPARSGSELRVTHCPRCAWDLAKPDQVDPTPEDKRGYLAMILGNRFHRTYRLFGGNVAVTFRTLKSSETDACWTQIGEDSRNGVVKSVGEHTLLFDKYRLLASLDTVAIQGQAVVKFPEIASVTPDVGQRTPLPGLLEWMDDHVLAGEGLRNAVAVAYLKFNNLVSKMEANAQNDPFWESTAAPS